MPWGLELQVCSRTKRANAPQSSSILSLNYNDVQVVLLGSYLFFFFAIHLEIIHTHHSARNEAPKTYISKSLMQLAFATPKENLSGG